MSILQLKKMKATQAPVDQVYVIYGKAGSGKTVLASTFPKTKEAPLLYLDILEGGIGSVDTKDKELIDKLLKGGYSTLSLGYIGVYETTKIINKYTGKNNE